MHVVQFVTCHFRFSLRFFAHIFLLFYFSFSLLLALQTHSLSVSLAWFSIDRSRFSLDLILLLPLFISHFETVRCFVEEANTAFSRSFLCTWAKVKSIFCDTCTCQTLKHSKHCLQAKTFPFNAFTSNVTQFHCDSLLYMSCSAFSSSSSSSPSSSLSLSFVRFSSFNFSS